MEVPMVSTAASGSLNIALYSSDLKPLINPKIIIEITQDLVNTATGAGGTGTNWIGFQYNCNSPAGLFTGYQQFVFESYAGFAEENITFIKGNSGIIADGWASSGSIPSPLPAGYRVEIDVQTDPSTGNTIGSVTTIYDQNGAMVGSQVTMSVTQITGIGTEFPVGTPWEAGWAAPITAQTMEIVGTGETTAKYTSGAGTIRYVPRGGQSYGVTAPGSLPVTGNPYYPFPAGLSIASNIIHTSENSNMQYSQIVEQADGSYLQYFSWNGTYPQGGPTTTTFTVSAPAVLGLAVGAAFFIAVLASI